MLKILPSHQLNPPTQAKCGEIFCHSFSDFTIYCYFCKMKIFAFPEFLLHLQYEHFENNLLQNETIRSSSNEFVKGQFKVDKQDESVCGKEKYENVEIASDYDDVETCSSVEDLDGENNNIIKVLALTTKSIAKRSKTKNKNEEKKIPQNSTLNETLANTKYQQKKTSKEQQFSCPECKEIFRHKLYLDRHVFEFHNGYKCSLCDKRFRLRHHLRRHLQTHNAVRKFPCTKTDCKRSFTDPEYLKHHLEMHTMERSFICEFENCGKAFHTQRRLSTHNYTHRKPKKLVCDICGYSCRAYATLAIHQRVHTGEKPFACENCQKSFVSKTALTEHMITHSSARPYVCSICQATFANQRILQRHTFIHSAVRTFKCKLCEKSFKQANGLDGHMRRLHREPKLPKINKNLE